MGVQCAATPLLKLPSNRVKLASTRSESAFVYARPSRDTGSAVAGAAGHLLQRSYTAGVHIRRRKLHSLVGNRLLTGPGGGFGGGNSGFGNGGGGGGGEYGGWGGASGSGGDRWPALVLELLLALVRGVCAVYSRLSVKHPYLLSSFLTASTFFFAECIMQLVVLRRSELDLTALVQACCYGFFIKGPLLRIFYGNLNKAIPSRKGWNLLKLLFLDCGVGNFMFSSLYTFTMPLLRGASVADAKDLYVSNILPLYCVGLKCWPIAMMLNYLYLPASLQVPYILVIDLFYTVALGMKAQQTAQKAVDDALLLESASCPSEGEPVSEHRMLQLPAVEQIPRVIDVSFCG